LYPTDGIFLPNFLIFVINIPIIVVILIFQFFPISDRFAFKHVDNTIGHFIEVCAEKLGSAFTGWRHVDLQQPGFVVAVQEDIKPVYLEAAAPVLYFVLTAFQSLHDLLLDLFLNGTPFAQPGHMVNGVLEFFFGHDTFGAIAVLFVYLFLLGVVGEVHGECFVVVGSVLGSAESTVGSLEDVGVEGHKGTHEHPLSDVKLPVAAEKQRFLDVFLSNFAILVLHDPQHILLDSDAGPPGDPRGFDDPPVLDAEVVLV
jgi:hypothetical protein